MDQLAESRQDWIRKNKYYYDNLVDLLKFSIPESSSIIEIGCGNGFLLSRLNPSRGVGIDISHGMIAKAKELNPQFEFFVMDAEKLVIDEKFDFIIISDTIGYFDDVQKSFEQLHKLCTPDTRIIITYINFLWLPVLSLAELLKLKMPHIRNNWLDISDITNLLTISGFDVIKSGRKFLMPFYIPVLSSLMNRFVSNLPGFNKFCLSKFMIARSAEVRAKPETVSVIIPARNERGNIETIVTRIPKMGVHTEIIFVEGNSDDGTADEIKRISSLYRSSMDIKYFQQRGKGKADAVREGFAKASGEILMILDADMTVPPEDLEKFYDAIVSSKGEFLNGSRLVYPLEKDAMRKLNMIGNKFFSVMFTWILNQRIKDTLCGTKVISRKNYEALSNSREFFGDFDPFGDFDLILGASKMNLKFTEIPIRYRARVYGNTNISRFKHGWVLLKMTIFAMRKMKFI